MKQLSWFAAVLCSALAFGCGGGEETGPAGGGGMTSTITDPVKLCEEVVKTECKRIYECATPQLITLGMLPANEAECNTQLKQALNCPAATSDKICTGDKAYSAAQANMCMAQANAATCNQIITNARNVGAYAPACGQCAPI